MSTGTSDTAARHAATANIIAAGPGRFTRLTRKYPPLVVMAAFFIAIALLVTVFADLLAPYHYTAQDLAKFGVIDTTLKEPSGGAHRDPETMIARTGDAIAQAFNDLRSLDATAIRQQRRQKFLNIGRRLG